MRPLFAPRESAASNLQKPAALQHFASSSHEMHNRTEARRRQSVQQTAPINHQSLGGGFCTTSVEGCQHCNHLQERRSNRLWELQRNLSSFHSRQDLRHDPAQQTIYSHNTRSSSGDTVWLQIQPEHSGYDILSPTTTRKVH